jgi:hypothetical protein
VITFDEKGPESLCPRHGRGWARSGRPKRHRATSNVELLPTPTYASYLNRIEATFGAIDEVVCKNADYFDWDAFGHALADHVRRRNDRSSASAGSSKPPDAANGEPRAAKINDELNLAA